METTKLLLYQNFKKFKNKYKEYLFTSFFNVLFFIVKQVVGTERVI